MTVTLGTEEKTPFVPTLSHERNTIVKKDPLEIRVGAKPELIWLYLPR